MIVYPYVFGEESGKYHSPTTFGISSVYFLVSHCESPIIKIVMTGLSARNAEKRIRAVASSPTILTLSVFIFFIPSYEFYFLFLSATCNVLLVSYLQSTIAALQILLQIPLQMFICNTLYNPVLHADKFSFHV